MNDADADAGRPYRLMVFGDSICAGSDAADCGPQDAWPALFAAAAGIVLVNRSRGGRPTDALDEFREALASAADCDGRAPDALLIALGTNDSRDLDPGMPARAVANLAAMVALARSAGIQGIVLAAPYNIAQDALRQTWPIRVERDRNLRLLGDAYRAYASETGLGFVSFYGCVPERCLAADGVHPDRAGNEAIRDYALVALRPLLV
ncbi:MAG: SGNH/GDSL hydrolase family protein [Planctomycetes bacterium]|nr:SGNH/GDSL hydrolase family protein [Planctomycetota bacterium]